MWLNCWASSPSSSRVSTATRWVSWPCPSCAMPSRNHVSAWVRRCVRRRARRTPSAPPRLQSSVMTQSVARRSSWRSVRMPVGTQSVVTSRSVPRLMPASRRQRRPCRELRRGQSRGHMLIVHRPFIPSGRPPTFLPWHQRLASRRIPTERECQDRACMGVPSTFSHRNFSREAWWRCRALSDGGCVSSHHFRTATAAAS